MTYPPPANPDPYGQPQQQPDPYNPYAAPGSPAPQYGQPQYAQPYPQPSAATNTMAILALVFAFVFAPLAIVFGHMAKKQIKQTGEGGEGLATAGLVLGYIFTGITVLFCCGYAVLIGFAASSSGSY